MKNPLVALLARVVSNGRLIYVDPSGRVHALGDGTGEEVRVRVADEATEWRIAFDPQLALGEAYMAGTLQVGPGTIYELLVLLFVNLKRYRRRRWERSLDAFRLATRRLDQLNTAWRSRRNVEQHYDIDGTIYDLFLDEDRQYSCAYFHDGDSLENAQIAKKQHLAAKLCLVPGHKVLDIGSGWGGLALYLASVADVDVTGVTLSTAQYEHARERACKLGLDRRVSFRLEDYRRVAGRFDRIVSVGMFEHVGVNHYRAFFDKVGRLLDDDGVAVVHTIGRSDGVGFTNPFIAKYIFPGGYFPALSEILPAVERSGLILTDVEVLRLHYADTLRAWRDRFLAQWGKAVALKGERFARMWEFYLAGSEAAFRHQSLVVFQLQLARHIDAVPLTRDYIGAVESRLSRTERLESDAARKAGA